MSVFTAVFDKLASRVKQRTATAHDRIEAAAKAIAKGDNVDVAGLEDSLFTVGMTLDGFRQLCDLFVARADNFAKLDGLGAARKKVEKIDKDIAAANATHAEAVEAYRKRYTQLRAEADQAAAAVDTARAARDWLLAVDHCPPSLHDEYVGALAAEEKANADVGNAQRDVHKLVEQIKSEQGWLTQLGRDDDRTLHPPEMFVTGSQRERMTAARGAKYDEHERILKRLEARKVDADKALADAQAALVAAEAVVAGVRKKILAA
jgi:hypothetical protein